MIVTASVITGISLLTLSGVIGLLLEVVVLP